jgi:hypothetical protein
MVRVPRPAQGIGRYAAHSGRDMDNYWQQVETSLSAFANPFAYYEELVCALRRIEKVSLVPAYELMRRDGGDRRLITLRHDLDADPVTGLRAARFLARYGICGSFYLLHTSPYYADVYGGVVIRNPDLPKWIRGYIVSGCELGLHNDALGVYQRWQMDGLSALLEELAFLRSHGAVVRGTVAHNSGPAYGAENYEVFAGRRLWDRKVAIGAQRDVPLGKMSERTLGLSYEGTFAIPKRANLDIGAAASFFQDRVSADIRSEKWMRRYLLDNPCCDWAVDSQFWLLGKDSWVAAGRFGETTLFEWDIGLERVLDLLSSLPDASRTLVVIHPEYIRA